MVDRRLITVGGLAGIALMGWLFHQPATETLPTPSKIGVKTARRQLTLPKHKPVTIPFGSNNFKEQMKTLATQVAAPPGPEGAPNLDGLYNEGLDLLHNDEKSFKKDTLSILGNPSDLSPRLGFFMIDVMVKGAQNSGPELAQLLGQKTPSAHLEGGLSTSDKNAILQAHALSAIRQQIAADGNADRFTDVALREELLTIVKSEPDVALVRSASRTLLAIDSSVKPTLSTLIHARSSREYFAYQDLGL